MCYSDVPYLYTGRGFAEGRWPYDGDDETRARYEVMEYPVGISYFAWGAAGLTQLGSPARRTSSEPAAGPERRLYGCPGGDARSTTYFLVTARAAGAFGAAGDLVPGRHPSAADPGTRCSSCCRRRCWSTGLVNWDLLAVAIVAGALWAWSRDRPVLTGVLIGLGTATKLYPLFLLGAILVVCLRRRDAAGAASA